MKKLILIAMAGILLSACSVTTQQQKRLTTVGGCVGGGYLGSHVGSGSGKTAATIVETLIGCGGGKILGDKITKDK